VSGSGCVSRSADDYTVVRATRAGTIRVAPRIDPLRALLHRTGPRCHDTTVTGGSPASASTDDAVTTR
jgi:hypothetical protein